MELNNWCCNSAGGRNMDSYVRRGYDRIIWSVNSGSKTTPRWRLLWRKLMKEKRRIFDCSSSTRAHFSYDAYGYSQNFDQGNMWTDPDTVSRSFSARFAVPSRVLFDEKNGLVG